MKPMPAFAITREIAAGARSTLNRRALASCGAAQVRTLAMAQGQKQSRILAWTFMNTLFSLHYAHGYYGEFGEPHKGLEFPGDEEPDYWDFAYFAFTIGMTFQVSDVQITTRYLRRVGLMHSAIAFFFNVFIIAISVNVAAGKA